MQAAKPQAHVDYCTLILPEKRIAIEFELTVKSKRRLQATHHQCRRAYTCDEVWYFCGSRSVYTEVHNSAKAVPHIKLHEFLDYV